MLPVYMIEKLKSMAGGKDVGLRQGRAETEAGAAPSAFGKAGRSVRTFRRWRKSPGWTGASEALPIKPTLPRIPT